MAKREKLMYQHIFSIGNKDVEPHFIYMLFLPLRVEQI